MGECDAMPNPYNIKNGHPAFDAPWVYALAWWTPLDGNKGICVTQPCHPSNWVNWTYNHDVYITLDELPGGPFQRVGTDVSASVNLLTVFPNPVSELLTLELGSAMENIQIYSLQGQLITEYNTVERGVLKLDVRDWVSGLYVIRAVGSNNKKVIRKVMIE